ncbi:hypothetical protein A6V29_04865 [Blastococcus sp. CCUG 61487]|nr:hypothetical protein A6V29_04865 [Blastococcus sp. CCUG 61487]
MDASGLASTVAANVRAELARHGMTAQDLATAIGVTPFYLGRRIGRQQRGAIAIDVDELERIAAVLGVTPEYLLRAPSPASPPGAPPAS